MPRKPRSGNHSNGGSQRRHGSKRKGSHTKGKDRAKADNLQFDPSKWESQKYVILGHLASSPICTAIIYKELKKPSLASDLAVELLLDDTRTQLNQRPPFPNASSIDPIFWSCTTPRQCKRMARSLQFEDNRRFPGANYDLTRHDFRDEPLWGDLLDSDLLDVLKPAPLRTTNELERLAYSDYYAAIAEEEKKAEDQRGAIPEHPRDTLFTGIQSWHQRLATWRAANAPNLSSYAKLQAFIEKILTSSSGLQQYKAMPPYFKALIYQSANSTIYEFFNKYIGRKHKHLKTPEIKHTRDGLALYDSCNYQQAKPSTNSGALILKKITSAKQLPGQPYAAFVDYVIHDLGEQYQEATGKPPDQSLMRMALTQQIQDFYKTSMSALLANESLSNITIPIKGQTKSVSAVMERYQNENPVAYAKYLKKTRRTKRKPRDSDLEEANAATGNNNQNGRNNRNNRGNNNNQDSGQKTFDCTWCLIHRPGCPTKHTANQCRIKRDHASTTCDICHQKGHPAKFCPSKTGRAQLAAFAESKAPAAEAHLSSAISISRPLTAKDARDHLRAMGSSNPSTKYKIVEVPPSSDQ